MLDVEQAEKEAAEATAKEAEKQAAAAAAVTAAAAALKISNLKIMRLPAAPAMRWSHRDTWHASVAKALQPLKEMQRKDITENV